MNAKCLKVLVPLSLKSDCFLCQTDWRKVNYTLCVFSLTCCDCMELCVIADLWTGRHDNVMYAAWLQMTIMMITVQFALFTLMTEVVHFFSKLLTLFSAGRLNDMWPGWHFGSHSRLINSSHCSSVVCPWHGGSLPFPLRDQYNSAEPCDFILRLSPEQRWRCSFVQMPNTTYLYIYLTRTFHGQRAADTVLS